MTPGVVPIIEEETLSLTLLALALTREATLSSVPFDVPMTEAEASEAMLVADDDTLVKDEDIASVAVLALLLSTDPTLSIIPCSVPMITFDASLANLPTDEDATSAIELAEELASDKTLFAGENELAILLAETEATERTLLIVPC